MAKAVLLFIFAAFLAGIFAGSDLEVRTPDGTGNNEDNDSYGANNQPLQRFGGASYELDGYTPRVGVPSARAVSNAMATLSPGSRSIPNSRNVNDILTYWGQWIDHDIDHSPTNGCEEPFNIEIPAGDPEFDAPGNGDAEMAFCRTPYLTFGSIGNPREIANLLTAWIDAGGIYGNTAAEVNALREFSGGRLLTCCDGEFGPFNNDGLGNILVAQGNNAARVANTELFAYGDARGNENAMLSALHALFIREHNRIADNLDDEDLDDEDKFQIAKRWVEAFNQAITYNEYLPALFGRNPIPETEGYDDSILPDIDAFFSTAAFRYGHSEVNDLFFRFTEGWTIHPVYGHLPLRNSYFFPEAMTEAGIEPLFRGAVTHQQQQVDSFVVDALRSQLFGFTTDLNHTAPAMDLLAINIQRGRDNGVPTYNDMRRHFDLGPRSNFNFISDSTLRSAISDIYGGDIELVDAIVGGFLEDQVSGSNLGELFEASLIDQFTRIRDGDRLFYLFDDFFDDEDVDEIDATSLADIMKRNTVVDGELDDLPDDMFTRLDIIDIQDNCEVTFSAGEQVSSFLSNLLKMLL